MCPRPSSSQSVQRGNLTDSFSSWVNLQNRANPPRIELLVAQPFGAGLLAGRRPQQEFENLFAYLLYRRVTVGDPARIDVHVVGHPAVGDTVARNLNHRDGGESDGAAPSGSKGDQICAASGKSRQRSGIVSGSIHENKTRSRDPLGVVYGVR